MNNRSFLIDNIKGLLIIFVVLGHSLEVLRRSIEIIRILYVFIYLFHMPVFVFLSGYLSKNFEKGRKYATRNLLMPYLLFNIFWGILQIISYFFVKDRAGDLRSDFFTILTPAWGMWYILSMFWWRLFLSDLLKIRNLILFCLIAGFIYRFLGEMSTFLALSRTFAFIPFFIAGYFFDEDKISKIREFSKKKVVLIPIITAILAVVFSKIKNIPDEFFWADRAYNNFNIDIFQCITLDVIRFVIGFVFVIVFFNLVPEKKTFLTKIGRNTMCIYFLHTYLIGTLMGLSFFTNNNIILIIIMLIGVCLVTFLLSRDKVSEVFIKFLSFIDKKIFIKDE